ncbi:MAG: aldehyde dehydrogenase family protein [Actinobacteria bacterium]|nr:aldehyde dehydrogenase family protein [Actinomycetota bacterium]
MSGPTVESRSPQAPRDVVISTAAADRGAVGLAAERARQSGAKWAAASATERADALLAAADALADAAEDVAKLVVREVGKTIVESRLEVERGVRILRFHAGAALLPDGQTHPRIPPAPGTTITMSRRRPRGVAGLITPWNFPVAIPLWKAAPALAYGNSVLLKPASQSTAIALRLAELLEPQLPPLVLQVVPGGAETGQALIEAADVISFTGSSSVGQSVAKSAVARGIPVQCEMGGLNSSIVLPDCDQQKAAAAIAGSIMGYAGQKCTATRRVIAFGNSDELADALVAAVEGLPVGDPAREETQVGPVIDADAARQVVDAGASSEGRVLTGGRAIDGDGYFVAPTLVDGLAPDARLRHEEVFGPIAALIKADSLDQALGINAEVPYGLVTSVFTNDLGAALACSDRLREGLIRVNQPTTGVDLHAPFGGEGASSYGPREQGLAAREQYTSTHTVTLAPPA